MEEFYQSAKRGDFKLVELYYNENKGILNYQSPFDNYRTALIIASKNNHLEIVRFLLEKRANVNIRNEYGATAIIAASEQGNSEIVELLCPFSDLNVQSSRLSHTALLGAILAGANVNFSDNDGRNASELAARKGWIFEKMLEEGLYLASSTNDLQFLRYILKIKKIDVNWMKLSEKGRTALIVASKYGFTEVVKLLLEQPKIDLERRNTFGANALIASGEEGKYEVIELLIKAKVNLNAQSERNKHTSLIGSCLNYTGEDINSYYKSAMLLLKAGASNIFEDSDGMKASDYAYRNGWDFDEMLYEAIFDNFHFIIFSSFHAYKLIEEERKKTAEEKEGDMKEEEDEEMVAILEEFHKKVKISDVVFFCNVLPFIFNP